MPEQNIYGRKVVEVDELIRKVRVVIDENKTSEGLLSTEDIETLSINDLIREKLPRAARIIEEKAPHNLLDSGLAFGSTIGWLGEVGIGAGVISLPDDFLRLVSFKMSDWDYAVTEPISEDSVEYQMQHSKYAGIRGNPQKPVVAIVQRPTGLSLEFYSCRAGSNVTLSRARYIPIPQIVNGGMGLSEKLIDAVVYYTGYLVALSIGEGELAKALMAVSEELMS